jgi:peptide/nickel transport system substrate-binding protein
MKSISRRQFLRVSAVAGAGAVLAACGGAKEETPAATEEVVEPTAKPLPPTATPKPEPTPTPPPVKTWPRETVERKRTLALMNGVHTVGIANPFACSHQQGGASQMEAMFYYAALNDKTYPWLAESFEYNDDATEMTVFIRKGILWNDGEPFTAKDVAFTFTWLAENAPVLRDSQFVKDNIEKVEAVDDYTVKFTFKEPNYRAEFNFCTYRFDQGVYLVPQHIFEGLKPPAADQEVPVEWKQWDPEGHPEWPVFTGPYKLTRTEQNFNAFDLRYEWWAVDVGLAERMPWPERITDIAYPSDEVGAQLIINNEVNTTLDMRPAVLFSILEQSDHIISHTGANKPGGYVDWWPISMYFNNLEWPYTDVKVRWAMAYAIDQQTLVDVGYDGAGKVTFTPFPDYPGITQYYDGAKAIFDQYNVLEKNLEKVDQLMTEAGFTKDGDGFWADAEGKKPDAGVYAAVPLFADIAPVTVELLRQAGFDSTHQTPPDVWTKKGDGTAFLHFFGHGGSVNDPYLTMSFYHSKWQKPTGQDCGSNRPRWANTEYDAVVEEMSRTPSSDKAKMQELFNKGMEIWYRELPEVPLVQWFHRLAMSTTYWTGWPNQDNAYNSAYWHLTFPITLWNLEPTQ